MIKIGGQFSGVGAFDEALKRLGYEYENIYQAEWDKHARKTYLANNEEPLYYVEDVRGTPVKEITEQHGSLDIFMSSPPCQSFSIAGKRGGENDNRGILFYESLRFIKINRPRYFIFENVPGLLSIDNGLIFNRWLDLLGGKSVNGTMVMFPDREAAGYHLHHAVLNAKDYGIPQNRARVFIVGIRDDEDATFRWPKRQRLHKLLKDALENKVNDKYLINDVIVDGLILNSDASIKVKSATRKGYEVAKEGDCVNYLFPTSTTRRGRVSCNIVPTIETSPSIGIIVAGRIQGKGWNGMHDQNKRVYDTKGISPTINTMQGGHREPKIIEGYKIRKLTPRECFRLMDFPDHFDISGVSDTQAYKQAGNSICVGVLAGIIQRLMG